MRSMYYKLAVHSMGNSPGHSLGQPPLDCTLAVYSTMYNTGLRKPREQLEFDQQYLSERIIHSFEGIRQIHA